MNRNAITCEGESNKRTLQKDTRAVLVHAKTKRDIATETLPAGTVYKVVSRFTDALGIRWTVIFVEGYRYHVLALEEV